MMIYIFYPYLMFMYLYVLFFIFVEPILENHRNSIFLFIDSIELHDSSLNLVNIYNYMLISTQHSQLNS